MAAKAPEAPKPAGTDAGAAAAAAPAAGGAKSWLPLIINVLMMPVLAYGMTQFVLIPKLNGSSAKAEASAEGGHGEEKAEGHGAEKADSHGEKSSSASSSHGGKTSGGKAKVIAPLSGKVLVNVAGTLGTRYLLANVTLVSNSPEIKGLVEKNDAQLRDVAAGILAVKTIPDLEKPGARNLIRTELISVFNNVLGQGTVNDIYLTEFAIQ